MTARLTREEVITLLNACDALFLGDDADLRLALDTALDLMDENQRLIGEFLKHDAKVCDYIAKVLDARDKVDAAEAREASVKALVLDGLYTDGGHHKQWFLAQIAQGLNIPIPDELSDDLGVAP